MYKPATSTGILTHLLATLALCAFTGLPATVAAEEDAALATDTSDSREDNARFRLHRDRIEAQRDYYRQRGPYHLYGRDYRTWRY